MSRFDKTIKLTTYKITKQCVESIEHFLKQDISTTLDIDSVTESSVSLEIHSNDSVATYSTIHDYKPKLFENGVTAVVMQLTYLKDSSKAGSIYLRFDWNGEKSILGLCIEDKNSKSKALIVIEEVLGLIDHNKTLHRYFYPREIITFPLLFIGILIGVFGFMSKAENVRPPCVITLVTIILYLALFRYLKGHCTFESRKQKYIDGLLNFFLITFVTFILTCLLTPVGNRFFNLPK